MNIFKTKYNVENIELDKIDDDSFYESLLVSILKIKNECKYIDVQIKRIGSISYIPGMSTLEQYEALIDLSNAKVKLINLYKAFSEWFKSLTYEQQRMYIMCFIKRDVKTSEQIKPWVVYKHKTAILNNFMKYMKTKAKLNESELIKCPLIHSLYTSTYNKNLIYKKRGLRMNKGDTEHDNSGNEKCHP